MICEMVKRCALFEVRTEFLNIIYMSFCFKRLTRFKAFNVEW
jgi:hypothetical protein